VHGGTAIFRDRLNASKVEENERFSKLALKTDPEKLYGWCFSGNCLGDIFLFHDNRTRGVHE
jgi:hypothetical protein